MTMGGGAGGSPAAGVCGACGGANPPGHRFCGQCGSSLDRRCPACGEAVATAQRFCGACGSPLATPGVAADAPSPPPTLTEDAGRRLVSVLFADLVGFTALAQDQDPEAVREFLSGYFEIARTVISRGGGTVEKFIGDAVMAVWGTETAREDDAERAVRAGLELIDQVSAYGEARQRLGLSARVGVVTGTVATWVSPGAGLVAGDRVNLASRVQAVADPGTVCVDLATREASQAGIEYAPAGTHALKGLDAPVSLWRAVRVLARVGGGGRGGEWEAPFVGRRRELAWLKDLYHDVADRGRARLLSVTGLAGVGKSRLTWELEKYLDGLTADTFWHRGRCLAYGDGVAFWPLREMIRGRLRLAEELPAAELEAALDRGLADLEFEPGEVGPLRASLTQLLGLGGAPLERAELFSRWRRLFELLAARAPVVMVVDDCQWADSALLDFLESLLDWSAESAVLVVTLARPELGERRPGWGTQRRTATALALEPLTPDEMAALLHGLVADLPPATRARIVAAAEGMPLYAVELVKALVDRGALVRTGERYMVAGPLADLPVPASLTALLAARLDALTPAARPLASRLAVFAGPFPRVAAEAVADLPGAELEAGLMELRRAEVLGIRSDPLAPDRGQYLFTQGLMRTAAYAHMARADRRAAHLAAAAHLQDALPDAGAEAAEAIAVHLQAAQAATPDGAEADRLRLGAAAAFARAGTRAMAVGAPASALRALRRAQALAPDDRAASGWQVLAAQAAIAAGDYDAAIAMTNDGPPVTADSDQSAALARDRASALHAVGRTAEAVAGLEQALADRAGRPVDAGAVRLRGYLAMMHFFAGHPDTADAAAERALVEGQELGVVETVARGAQTRGQALLRRGRFQEALLYLEWSLRLATEAGDIQDQITGLGNLADAEAQFDLPRAEDHLETTRQMARRAGRRGSLVASVSNLLWVWTLRGRWEQAERLAAEHLDDETSPLHPTDRFYLRQRLAVLAAWRGDPVGAEAHVAALEEMTESDDVQARAMAGAALVAVDLAAGRAGAAVARGEPLLAEVTANHGVSHDATRQLWPDVVEAVLAAGDPQPARRLIDELAARPPGTVPPYLRAQLGRLRGLAANAGGEDHEAAVADLTAAVEAFRTLAYPYWLARAQLDLAVMLAGHGDPRAAEQAMAAAEGFADLGASAWADRSRQLAGAQGAALPAPAASGA